MRFRETWSRAWKVCKISIGTVFGILSALKNYFNLRAGWMVMLCGTVKSSSCAESPLTLYPHKICIFNHAAFRVESGRASTDTPLIFQAFFLFLHLYLLFPALQYADFNIGICGWFLVLLSLILTLITLPISIWMCIKVSVRLKPLCIFSLHRILMQGVDDGRSMLIQSGKV